MYSYMLGEDMQEFEKARGNDGIFTVTERNLSFANGSEKKENCLSSVASFNRPFVNVMYLAL